MAARALDHIPEAEVSGDLTAAALEKLLKERPADVDAALQQVSPFGNRIGLVEIAAFLGVRAEDDPAAFASRAIAYLTMTNLLAEFSSILLEEPVLTGDQIVNMRIDPAVGERLFSQTVQARCAVLHQGQFQGSGAVVGPSLVLTCAHVISGAKRGERYPSLEVELPSGLRLGLDETPVRLSDAAEADSKLPLECIDDPFADHFDFALLRLRTPIAANAVVVEFPAEDWPPSRRAPLFLLHYPQGTDRGVAVGQLESFRRPTVRWGYHSDEPKPGSSGGACFNSRGELVGIHQGKLTNGSRLVPLRLFREQIAPEIANDLTPPYLWSPEGRLEGTLVIGRGALFRAFALMAPASSTYRLLRIKRTDPGGGPDGLGFSVRLVRQLVDRLPKGHREITLSWPQALFNDFDIVDELAQSAAAAGLLAAAEPTGSGPTRAGGQPRKERVQRLLEEIESRASAAGETVWIVVEHSAVPLADQIVPLELLADMVPKLPSLRMVVIGNESLSLPEAEFRIDDVSQNSLPGVTLVEYLGPVSRHDVEEFILGMYTGIFGEAPDAKLLGRWTDAALAKATPELNRYPLSEVAKITAELRNIFRPLMPADQTGSGT